MSEDPWRRPLLLVALSVAAAGADFGSWDPEPAPLRLDFDRQAALGPRTNVTRREPFVLQLGQELVLGSNRVLAATPDTGSCDNLISLSEHAHPTRHIYTAQYTTPTVLQFYNAGDNCTSGDRVSLSVEWAPSQCGNDSRVCNAHGACLFRRDWGSFGCLCCNGQWRPDGDCPPCAMRLPNGSWPLVRRPRICSANPCQNDGVCTPLGDRGLGRLPFLCLCGYRYSGLLCQTESEQSCDPNPCPSYSHCFLSDDEIECVSFDSAQRHLRTCESHICADGGECFLVRGSPRCICKPAYFGLFCQRSLRAVEGGANGFLSLVGFVAVFFATALLLVICNCHTWTCYCVSGKKKDYFDAEEDNSLMTGTPKPKAPGGVHSSHGKSGGFQMYTLEDASVSSDLDSRGSLHDGGPVSERDFLVSQA